MGRRIFFISLECLQQASDSFYIKYIALLYQKIDEFIIGAPGPPDPRVRPCVFITNLLMTLMTFI